VSSHLLLQKASGPQLELSEMSMLKQSLLSNPAPHVFCPLNHSICHHATETVDAVEEIGKTDGLTRDQM